MQHVSLPPVAFEARDRAVVNVGDVRQEVGWAGREVGGQRGRGRRRGKGLMGWAGGTHLLGDRTKVVAGSVLLYSSRVPSPSAVKWPMDGLGKSDVLAGSPTPVPEAAAAKPLSIVCVRRGILP